MYNEKLIPKEKSKNYKTLAGWITRGCFPNAVIIEGTSGTGRHKIADLFAESVLCESQIKPCGNCRQCLKVEKHIHPDILYFEGEGGAKSFHIDKVRKIREEAWVSPNDADSKIFILERAEELTVQAQNALLKVIEEPPDNVYFVFICQNKNGLLSTILSRSVVLSTQPPSKSEALEILCGALPGKTKSECAYALERCIYNPDAAKEYLESEETRAVYDSANDMWQSFVKHDIIRSISIASKYEKDKQGFLKQLEILREITSEKLINCEKKNAGGLSLLQLAQILDIIDEMIGAIRTNANLLLVTTIFVSKVSRIIRH